MLERILQIWLGKYSAASQTLVLAALVFMGLISPATYCDITKTSSEAISVSPISTGTIDR